MLVNCALWNSLILKMRFKFWWYVGWVVWTWDIVETAGSSNVENGSCERSWTRSSCVSFDYNQLLSISIYWALHAVFRTPVGLYMHGAHMPSAAIHAHASQCRQMHSAHDLWPSAQSFEGFRYSCFSQWTWRLAVRSAGPMSNMELSRKLTQAFQVRLSRARGVWVGGNRVDGLRMEGGNFGLICICTMDRALFFFCLTLNRNGLTRDKIGTIRYGMWFSVQ